MSDPKKHEPGKMGAVTEQLLRGVDDIIFIVSDVGKKVNWDLVEALVRGPDVFNEWREADSGRDHWNMEGITLVYDEKISARLSPDGISIGFPHGQFAKLDFRNADMSGSVIEGYTIVSLEHFTGSRLQRAKFAECKFRGTAIRAISEFDLRHVEFQDVDFGGARFSNVSLSGTRFGRNCHHFALDSCMVRDTVFDPFVSDPWTVLRRTYTGISMILNFAFIVAFFAPVFAKALSLMALSYGQGLRPNAMAEYCADESCRTVPVIQILLGFHEPFSFGWAMPIATLFLIIYQAMRFWMTRNISIMRENEERSGLSPRLGGANTGRWYLLSLVPALRANEYWAYFHVHRALQIMAGLGVLIFAWRMAQFLFASYVQVPV